MVCANRVPQQKLITGKHLTVYTEQADRAGRPSLIRSIPIRLCRHPALPFSLGGEVEMSLHPVSANRKPCGLLARKFFVSERVSDLVSQRT